MPWDVISIIANVVTLRTGDVEIHGDDGTDYITSGDLTETLSGSGTEYLWVDLDMTSPSSPSATLEHGASKPESNGTHYRKLLWSFLNGAIAVRWHAGNVEFTGWKPPYE